MEPASALPEPHGKIPTGVLIACSQSGLSMRPLITCTEQKTKHTTVMSQVSDSKREPA